MRSPEAGPTQPASGRPQLCWASHPGAPRERGSGKGAGARCEHPPPRRAHLSGRPITCTAARPQQLGRCPLKARGAGRLSSRVGERPPGPQGARGQKLGHLQRRTGKRSPTVRSDLTFAATLGMQRAGPLGTTGRALGWGARAGTVRPLISMQRPSPLASPAAAWIPDPSPRARTLISLQMVAGGAGCNKRQKLRSGASMRAFSPITRGWIQQPGAV